MSELYDEYKNSKDKTVELDGEKYYKIIDVSKFMERNIIVLPMELFFTTSKFIKDEKGKIFELGEKVYFSFRGTIPDWYLETMQLTIDDVDQMGNYVRQVERS